MIAAIASLFGSRLAPRRGRTSIRRRRPTGRRIAIESLEPRQLLAIDVVIVDNSGLASSDALLYVTGHGIPGNDLLPDGKAPQQKWTSPTPELRILDTTAGPGFGKFTQAAVTIDSIAVMGTGTGTTAKFTTTVPHQLSAGQSVFVSGTFGTSGSQPTIDAFFANNGVGFTGALTVTKVNSGTDWSVAGVDPFTSLHSTDAGWFEVAVPEQAVKSLTLAGSAAAYLPTTISTPTVTAVSAASGVVTVTLSEPANLPLNSPIFIQGLSEPALNVTAPTSSAAIFTNASLAAAGALITVTTNGAHGLVPGQEITVTSSDTAYNFTGQVGNTGLFDGSLASNQFTYSLTAAPTSKTATATSITPTLSGAIAVSTTQLVVNLSSTAPTSGSATLSGNSETTFNGAWAVTTIPAIAGLPDTAVWLTASGTPFTTGDTGSGGTVSTGSIDLNGLQLVSQNASTNPALTARQFQYSLTNASGTVPSVTGVSLSVVTVKPVAVAALPKNGQSLPIVTLDDNIKDFSAQLVQMVTPAGDLPFPLGITPGEAAISNLGTPPFAIGTQAGNSVADIVEFYYAGSGPSDYSTFDLSGVDGFALPLTLSSSAIKPPDQGKPANVSTVGLNTALGTTRKAVGTAFGHFIGNEPADVKATSGADFSRLLYDGQVSRNLGVEQAALPVAANLPAKVLHNVTMTVGTVLVVGAPTSFNFLTAGNVQIVPSSEFAQGQPWSNVAVGQIVAGGAIPANTYVESIQAETDGHHVTFNNSIPSGPLSVTFSQQTGVVTATYTNPGLVPGQKFTITNSDPQLNYNSTAKAPIFSVASTKLSDSTLSKDEFTFSFTPTTTPVFPASTTTVTADEHGVIAWGSSNLLVQVDGSFASTPVDGGSLEIAGLSVGAFNGIYTVGPAGDYGLPADSVLLTVPGGATPFTLGQTADGGATTSVSLPIFQAPPSVPDNQIYVIAAPKDWLIQQGAPVAIDDPMATWWDTTIDAFFKDGNYLQVAVGTPLVGSPVDQSRMYTGVYNTASNAFDFYWSADTTKTVQFSISKPTPENITPAIAPPPSSDPSYPKYESLANALWVWAQAAIPSGDQGLVWDQILQAFCRGVALDGVSTTEPSSTTSAASNAAWTLTTNWYKERVLPAYEMTSRYCPYSKFLHFGTLNGGTDLTGTTSIYVGGLAYGFSEDEVPVGANGNAISPLGGPSKMDGTVPDGATLTLIVNPWASTAGPTVNAPLTFTVPENTGSDPGSNLVWPASPTPFSDTDSDTLIVTLEVTAGTINGTDSPAHTGVTVGGTATARTFSGTITSLNAYFTTSGQITYTPPLDDLTSQTLTTRASDGTRAASATSTINIVAAELPQVSLAPTTFTIEQDGPRQVALDFTTASFTDPADLPADTVYTVKMTGSGTIQATSAGGVTFSSLGGGVYTFAGTLTNLDAYFQTPDRILYIPPLGSRTPTSPSFHGTRHVAVTLIRPTDEATSEPVTLTIVVQPNQPPVIQAPLTFAVTLNVQTPLVWPAAMTPFSDASAESLTVTLAVPTGVLAGASSGGVTVSGSTDIQKQFVGTVAALNAYFKAANISYTATGTTSQSRPLTITASDGAAQSEATSTIVVHNPTPDPNGPPTINPTTVLEWATENQWFVITYDQLVAASGANDPAHRTVEFTLAAINSGTLQMNWHGMWITPPTPRFGQPPPFLMQGGTIRWMPPANMVNSSGQLAFTVGLFDLNQRSLGTSQVFIKIRA
jgi:hypothetical protein